MGFSIAGGQGYQRDENMKNVCKFIETEIRAKKELKLTDAHFPLRLPEESTSTSSSATRNNPEHAVAFGTSTTKTLKS